MKLSISLLAPALALALAVASACTKHNPASCCTSALQCASVGLGEMHECQGIDVCDSDGTCVPPECITSADCKDADRPICSGEVCVGTCADDTQCSAATPHCGSAGACVECTQSGQCPSGTPVCDPSTNTCVQAPPQCVPELLVLRGNPAFGLLNGQLFHISPKDLVENALFTQMNQSDAAYSPDGSRLAWVQSSQILWVGDADGQNAVKIDDVSQNSTFTAISNPRWSPDGAHLAYQIFPVGQPDVHIWTSNLTGSPINITTNAEADSAEWSPNGAKILFQSSRTGNVDVFTMNPDGSNQTNLTSLARDQQAPHWSPDGNSIVFFGSPNGTVSIAISQMNSDGSGRQGITSPLAGVADTDARWVSNQQIAYTHSVSGSPSQIYVTSPQGTNQHVFASSASSSSQSTAMPSPDGKYIAWSEDDNAQNTQMWLSTVDMPMPVRITNSAGLNNVALGWKPCP